MTTRMRLLHWLLRALSDPIMLPLFGVLGGTRDSTLGGRMCVLLTVRRKRGQPRELSLNYVPTTRGVGLLAGFGRFHLVSDERPPWVATAGAHSG